MSFSYSARGTRDEVVSSLDSLTMPQLGNDPLGANIRDTLVEAISMGTELIDPSDQRYQVDVTGHSGHGAVVTLTATVKVVTFPFSDITEESATQPEPVTT